MLNCMQMRHPRLTLVLAAIAIAAAPASGRGQDIQLRTPGPRTLTGVVKDTTGFVLDAEIMIVQLKLRTSADASGQFTFRDVRPGRYQVGARRLGYFPQVKTVIVTEEGGVVEFSLVPMAHALPPVVTAAQRGGLSGVVGDTAFNVIQGAEVQIISTARRATSDSTGSFFIDAPPGKHMVRVKREGFAPRMISVTVPRDSGRRMLVWLQPASDASMRREEAAIDSMRERLMRRSVATSALYTREDINRVGFKELSQIAQSASAQYVDEMACSAILPGTGRRVPLWTLSASELEAVEVYWSNQKRARYTIGGNSARAMPSIKSIAAPPSAFTGCPTIYAWLRK